MQNQFDVVVVGEINADLILSGNVIPEFNQVEKIIDNANLVMGSSAVIFACGCARLGLKTAFMGKVGNDLFGRFMIESMEERGINTTGVLLDPTTGTGLSIILATKNDRAILTFPGVIPELEYPDLNLEILKRSRHLHLSSYYLLDRLRPDVPLLFKQAKDYGMSISLDTNYDPSEKWTDGLEEVFKLVDVFLPNETEAKAITGSEGVSDSLQKLAMQVDKVVVKLGAEGAIGTIKGNSLTQQKTISIDVVDTVGAGDSFDAGFVYGFLQNWSLKKSLRFAVACGSLSTMASGGTSGQATVEEAQAFIRKYF